MFPVFAYWILSVPGRRRWAMRFATHALARETYDRLTMPAMLVKREAKLPVPGRAEWRHWAEVYSAGGACA